MSKELPKRYTPEEDQEIMDAVQLALDEGRTVAPVLAGLAEKLGRTPVAIDYRYYNVLKKKDEQLEVFVPWVGDAEEKRLTARNYTQSEDDRILEVLEVAESEGIPFSVVWPKLGEEMNRSERALEVRYYSLKRKLKGETASDEDDDDDEAPSIIGRLKSLVKERDSYKSKYEAMKKEFDEKYETMKANHDKMARELRQIRKLIE